MQDIKMPKIGEIVEGKVIKVEENTIYLDLQAMTEGKIHLDNYSKPAPSSFFGLVKNGDIVRAKIKKITDEPAQILLSRLPLILEESFIEVKKYVEDKTRIKAKIIKILDKGLVLNYKAHEIFLPYSHLDYDLLKSKENLKGSSLEIILIEASKIRNRSRIIASRKEIYQEKKQQEYDQRLKKRKEELDGIKTGDVIEGTIQKIEKHAATVKFRNIIGLLRISQVSHHRIEDLNDFFEKNQKVKVKVIKKEGNRLDLSIKALVKSPFEKFNNEYKVGDKITGSVYQKLPFGIVFELLKGVRGLLHMSEYSWNSNEKLSRDLKIGSQLEMEILSIDSKTEKIRLSRKKILENPWKNFSSKKGDVVKAEIVGIEKNKLIVSVNGAKAELKEEELIKEKNEKLDDKFEVGQKIEALVLNIDKTNWKIDLSMRRLIEKNMKKDFKKMMIDENDEDSQLKIGDLFEEKFKG
jgi:small subunit ribosomal protein S1